MTSADDSKHARWARFRFSVIGPLLAAPPARGDLATELTRLSKQTWRHPITGGPVRFGRSTIERWLYQAREAKDPVARLRRQVRKDAGQQPSLSDRLRQVLVAQYHAHPSWSAKLHTDNLEALARQEFALAPVASVDSVRRYLKAQGLERQRRRRGPRAAGTREPLEAREVRSYEAEYVHGLWHADFHHGSRKIVRPDGRWQTPLLLGVLDDCSRVVCHLQWYLDETAASFVHGLCQAIQKRGLPRALMTDNGPAMLAAETRAGLETLGIVHETTRPYSPHQNAKQEVLWAQVEGRLLAMLEGVDELSLALLNDATQAWVEGDYHRQLHAELGMTPLARFRQGPDVGRESPASEALRQAFRAEASRTQRRSDGTVSVCGCRFELPSRYRQLTRVRVRYARWDLSTVDLVDVNTGEVLCALFPQDKTRNADGRRRTLEPRPEAADASDQAPPSPSSMAPLLRELMAEFAATGRPPAYLPTGRDSTRNPQETDT
jgi:transposase InsO family protein